MRLASSLYYDEARPGPSPAALGIVVAVHILVVWLLLHFKVIALPAPLAVLSVSLLPPAPEIRPQPDILPPKPLPVARKPVPAPVPDPTVLAAPADSPSPSPIAVPPAPTPVPAPAPVAATPVAAPTPPRFDADYLDNPKPAYPAIARRMGEQGRVVLRVRVDAQGLPIDVQLHASSGSERLDASALQTVRRWKFVPARLGNEPVAASVLVPIAFTLKD
ncbi:MAG: energy transducer TonB [Sulfuritalea sp.]|nr:energy transducer TonB [Sulfuritalea sp.]